MSGPVEPWVHDAILRVLIDRPQAWRERSVERIEPLSRKLCRRRMSLQFRISREFIEKSREVFGDERVDDMIREGWRQTIPLARLPKGTLLEFSCRDAAGVAIPIKNHFDGAYLTRDFLTDQFEEVCKETETTFSEDVLKAMEAYCYLAASSAGESLKDAEALRSAVGSASSDKLATAIAARFTEKAGEFLEDGTRNVSKETIDEVARYLANLRSLAERLQSSGVRGIVEQAWFDPLVNPLLMAKSYARWQQRTDQPWKNADEALVQCLKHATRVFEFQKVAFGAKINPPGDKWATWSAFIRETYLFAHAWIIYVDADVRVGQSFLIKIESIEKVVEEGEFDATREYMQEFPIGPKDFLSKHVEVAAAEPEIEITRAQVWNKAEKEWQLALSAKSSFREGVEAKPHILHYVVSDPNDAIPVHAIENWTEEFGNAEKSEAGRRLRLRCGFNVAPPVRYGYYLTAGAMVAVLSFALARSYPLLTFQGPCPENLSPLVLSAIGFAAVLILFAAARHRNALVASLVRVQTGLVLGSAAIGIAALMLGLLFLWIQERTGIPCPGVG